MSETPTTFHIRNRWTGAIQFSCELSGDVSGHRYGLKLGFAVKKALEARADLNGAALTGAALTGAALTGADLTGADLTRADLTRAALTGADLTGADLTGAALTGAALTGADLTGAALTGADLTGAALTGAALTGADLTGADLTGADLTGAALTGADLTRAALTRAALTGADLTGVKQDFLAEVLRLPNELEALCEALIAGKVDGSTYSGECACLAGTLAKAHGIAHYAGDDIEIGSVTFHARSYSPREMFFRAICPGNTPDNSAAAKIALEWTQEAIAIRDMIRATAPTEAA
jgi:uncharacterized protein YjbI with pentapeptide repeats